MVQRTRLDARQNEEEGESIKHPYGRAYQKRCEPEPHCRPWDGAEWTMTMLTPVQGNRLST